jgi:phosphatidylglycerophosphate synthase
LLGKFRRLSHKFITPTSKVFARAGLTPNLITAMDLFSSIASTFLLATHRPLEAAISIILSGFLDAVDGEVARLTGKKSGFGATLDAVVDRYTEFFQALGAIFGGYVAWWLGMAVAFTMNASSYARARAESTGGMSECSVGLIERPEKLTLLALGAIMTFFYTNAMEYIFWLLLILGQVTVLQRLNANRKHSKLSATDKSLQR